MRFELDAILGVSLSARDLNSLPACLPFWPTTPHCSLQTTSESDTKSHSHLSFCVISPLDFLYSHSHSLRRGFARYSQCPSSDWNLCSTNTRVKTGPPLNVPIPDRRETHSGGATFRAPRAYVVLLCASASWPLLTNGKREKKSLSLVRC